MLPPTTLLAAIVVPARAGLVPAAALPVGRLGRTLRRPRTRRAVECVGGAALAVLGPTLGTAPLLR
ncbi:hypothetical protein [Streptomyces wuyuanensis]|uniref:hypothetical protein n=1 Tax=Streptomyces wuyuanensis TaxID=1196353 RepID=UPI003444ECB7